MAKKVKTIKKEGPKPVPSTLFDRQVDLIRKEFGDGVLETLEDMKTKPVLRTSSGSLAIDYILSPKLGGMRNGMLLQLWGAPSCGKTTLALGFAANVTAAKKRVVFVDAERTLDMKVAEAAGVDTQYFTVLKKRTEEAVNILYRLLQTGEVGAVIIDSISAIKPSIIEKKEKDLDITRKQVGYHSNFIARWIDEIVDLCAEQDVLLISINQMRNNLGMYMGGTKPASGGYSYEHAVAASIRMSGHVKHSSSRIVDSDGRVVGQSVKCVCDKSKVDRPQKEVSIPLYLGLGVNPFNELVDLATGVAGVIVNKGAFYYLAEDPENYIAQGSASLVNKLYEDNELFKKVRQQVIEALELNYPEDQPFINPFLNPDLTPKFVEYNQVTTEDDESAVG